MPEFEPVIGLEVHAQLRTRSKIFCACEVRFGAPPNSLTCPVCLGLPGALPVLNRGAVTLALRLGLALGCIIRGRSIFARKNYFYPDLPKGYQISQFDLPLAEHGRLTIEIQGTRREIGIRRVHMEEDAGKLIHEGPLAVEDASIVDFNRSGVPLAEIVGEAELRSPEEAYDYLTRLKSLLTYTEVCDGNMEEGSLRCDANVSIREKGAVAFGTRVELKNLNSFRNVERALRYEIGRQAEVVRSGGKIVQETLLYDADSGKTRPMRSKEEAHDYRYFPDPDLLPLTVSSTWIEEVRATLPELPTARRDRFVAQYALSDADAHLLALEKPLADYFEAAVFGIDAREALFARSVTRGAKPAAPPREIAKRVLRELMKKMKDEGLSSGDLAGRYPAVYITELVNLQEAGVISGPTASEVFELSWLRAAGETAGEALSTTPRGIAGFPAHDGATATPEVVSASPSAIVAASGLAQISDEAALQRVVETAVGSNPKQLAQYRSGKESLFGFFVGQVMRETGGRANPSIVNRLLKEHLSKTA